MNHVNEADKEQKENLQMNWFAGVVLILGSPLFILTFLGHNWAELILKVYLCTSAVFGSLLLFIERKALNQGWLWWGMIPNIAIHSLIMYGVISLDRIYPQIDRFPVATYGALIPIVVVEVVVYSIILDWFKPSMKT
jgi:hypothetical protein